MRLKREDSAEIGVRSIHTELPATVDARHELLAVDRRVTTAIPTSTRYIVQVPLPDAARRRGRAARDRSRQGRRRAAPGQPRASSSWACAAARVRARRSGIQALLVHVQGPDRGPARRDHRARAHDRPAAREPALAEGADTRTRRSRCATPGTAFPARSTRRKPTSSSRPRAVRRSSRPTWCGPARRSSARA